MRKRTLVGNQKGPETINVSPLIDMVFILLIFFIVGAVFVKKPIVDVNKIPTKSGSLLAQDSLLFAVTDKNELYYGAKVITVDDLGIIVRKKLKRSKMSVVLQLDKMSDASFVAVLLEKLSDLGVDSYLSTKQKL